MPYCAHWKSWERLISRIILSTLLCSSQNNEGIEWNEEKYSEKKYYKRGRMDSALQKFLVCEDRTYFILLKIDIQHQVMLIV